VLVIDAGAPRNVPAAAMHNFLSRDRMNPLALLETGRAEVRGYGGPVLDCRVRSATRAEAGFSVTLEDGRVFAARRLLVTTGLVDQLPDIPGLRERWGAAACSTAPTAMVGRSATRRWASSLAVRWPSIRPCCFDH
jgi:thioredoxin reductase